MPEDNVFTKLYAVADSGGWWMHPPSAVPRQIFVAVKCHYQYFLDATSSPRISYRAIIYSGYLTIRL